MDQTHLLSNLCKSKKIYNLGRYRLFEKLKQNNIFKICLFHFFQLYGCVGRSALTVMVNSTWTEKHILDLWNVPFRTHRVYPPCEVSHLKNLEHIESDKITIVSVGQFRPEKGHPLQLQAMYELRTKLQNNEPLWEKV